MYNRSMTKQLDYLKLKKSALVGRGERRVFLDQKVPKLIKERDELIVAMKRDAEVIALLEKYTTRKKELSREIPKLEKLVTSETGEAARVSLVKLQLAREELESLDEKMRAAYYAR